MPIIRHPCCVCGCLGRVGVLTEYALHAELPLLDGSALSPCPGLNILLFISHSIPLRFLCLDTRYDPPFNSFPSISLTFFNSSSFTRYSCFTAHLLLLPLFPIINVLLPQSFSPLHRSTSDVFPYFSSLVSTLRIIGTFFPLVFSLVFHSGFIYFA